MGRSIVITSGKGGVGKTTICAGLGASLAMSGANVILVDADVGLNNLDVVMGVDNKIVYDILDVINGKCRVRQALIPDPFIKTLSVLPSARRTESAMVTETAFRTLIERVKENCDYLLIDCPAGIDTGFHRAVSAAREVIVVTTPQIPAIRDADKVLALLSTYRLEGAGLLVNRVRGDLVMRGEMMSPSDINKVLRVSLLGAVPEDDNLMLKTQLGGLPGESDAMTALAMAAHNLESGERRIFDCTARYRGIMGKLKMIMRKEA